MLAAAGYREALVTDLVERARGKAERGSGPGSIRFDLGPFQIKTLKLVR